MMKHAEAEQLRFVTHVRSQYATEHSFSDKLYDPRSGLGMFYRWKPRHVQRLCAARGIVAPKVHVSAIERIVQAPEGYAPGNVPPGLQIVTTETFPQARPADIAAAVAMAHHSMPQTPLSQTPEAYRWVRVGLISYFAFIIGMVGALARTLGLMLVSPAVDFGAFVDSANDLITSFPFGLARTLWSDPLALALAGFGLVVGFALNSWSGRRINALYTSFWHQHREQLRTALRRSPPVSAPAQSA
jgi:hypothetical protein